MASKGEMTRQRIVAAAAPIFNQRGFAGCSMQDVLEATGLEKGGVYRHFASKEELAAESFRYMLTRAVKTRTEHLSEIDGAIPKLRQVVKRFVETPSTEPGGCPLMNTAVDSDDGNPVLRELCRQGIADWKGRLAAIVDAGLAAGEIREGVEARQVANAIVSTLEGALMISRMEGTRVALEDAGGTLDLVLDSIAAAG